MRPGKIINNENDKLKYTKYKNYKEEEYYFNEIKYKRHIANLQKEEFYRKSIKRAVSFSSYFEKDLYEKLESFKKKEEPLTAKEAKDILKASFFVFVISKDNPLSLEEALLAKTALEMDEYDLIRCDSFGRGLKKEFEDGINIHDFSKEVNLTPSHIERILDGSSNIYLKEYFAFLEVIKRLKQKGNN